MCLARVYTSTSTEQPVCENVASLRLAGDTVEVETLFGDKQQIDGQIEQIDFVKSRIEVRQDPQSPPV